MSNQKLTTLEQLTLLAQRAKAGDDALAEQLGTAAGEAVDARVAADEDVAAMLDEVFGAAEAGA